MTVTHVKFMFKVSQSPLLLAKKKPLLRLPADHPLINFIITTFAFESATHWSLNMDGAEEEEDRGERQLPSIPCPSSYAHSFIYN